MGIFGSNRTSSEVDSLIFEDSTDSSDSSDSIRPKSSTNFGQLSPSKATSGKYGINQATKLVRSFQKHNISSNVIAGIMKQTLASVEIHFTDIIDDAKRKETAVQTESEKKDKQIEEATRKCEALKEEKTKLQEVLKETISVREFLLQAMDSDSGQASGDRTQQTVVQPSDKSVQQPAAQPSDKPEQNLSHTQEIEPLP